VGRRTRLGVIGIIGAVFSIAMCTTGMAQERTPLTFQLAWTPVGGWAPYWLALDRGYFAKEGLEVTFQVGSGSGTAAKVVAQGAVPIGNPDLGVMMKGVVKGMELKAVFGEWQKTSAVIISRRDKAIRTPKDLIGKSIAMAPEESSAQLFPALLAGSGVDPSKVKIVHPASGAKVALFLNGDVDAITGSSNFQAPTIEAKGVKIHMFSYGDFGVNTLNNGIVVNAKWLTKNGDVVRRFLRALVRAWDDTIKNPKAAVDALIHHYPDQKDQYDIVMAQLRDSITLIHTEYSKNRPRGWMAKEDWVQTQDLLSKYGGLETTMPVEQYYTNEYVPQQ
jgi:NitT/TauT family transport system substrate-binding protein